MLRVSRVVAACATAPPLVGFGSLRGLFADGEEARLATLLHGSAAWRRKPGDVGRRPFPSRPDPCRAVQSQCRSPLTKPPEPTLWTSSRRSCSRSHRHQPIDPCNLTSYISLNLLNSDSGVFFGAMRCNLLLMFSLLSGKGICFCRSPI